MPAWCGIPDSVSFDEASFVEPLNTCLKGRQACGSASRRYGTGRRAGTYGLLFTQLARLARARVVATDRLEYRLALARRIGAEAALSPEEDVRGALMSLSDGRGADLAIVAVADTRAAQAAFDTVRPAGRAALRSDAIGRPH